MYYIDTRKFCPPNPSGNWVGEWQMFQESCYHLFGVDVNAYEKTPRTFDEARSYCHTQGGDLVSLSSQEEENFLPYNVIPSSQMYKEYWIGMQRKNDAGGEDAKNDYEWTDGTISDYRRFEGKTNETLRFQYT